MMKHLSIALAMGAGLARSQATVETPRFDVAAIHLSPPGCRGTTDTGPGHFFRCQSLSGLIASVYFQSPFPPPAIEGGQSWISDRYGIDAFAEGASSAELNGPMLRNLLAERFQLKAHFEIRGEVPVYTITVDKGGHMLRPGNCSIVPTATEKRCTGGTVRPGGEPNLVTVDLQGGTFAEIANLLTVASSVSVHDNTGLTERFDFHLEFAIDDTSRGFNPAGASDPTISSALKEFGLKIERGKEPRRVLVIDSVERPSEN